MTSRLDRSSFEEQRLNKAYEEKIKSLETPFVGRECLNCWKTEQDIKLYGCARCRIAKYCSTECQKEDWPKHKQVCQIFKESQIIDKKDIALGGIPEDPRFPIAHICAVTEKALRNGHNIDGLWGDDNFSKI